MKPQRPFVLIDDSLAGRARIYGSPERVVRAEKPEELAEAFSQMEEARRAGFHLAGYVSYELGYLLESRLMPLLPARRDVPLLQFGVFREPASETFAGWPHGAVHCSLAPAWILDDYRDRFDCVLSHIAAGNVYQINLTFPLSGTFSGDPLSLFLELRQRQPVRHGAVVALGEETILSLSPELFFSVEAGRIITRPMKGTAPRGLTEAADRAAAIGLAADDKQRAENLMIVDLLRNDLSRIAKIGSVHVPRLFEVETYPTLHQMTSTVMAEIPPDASIAALFAGLFPCGSVTGAPKIRAMEIIRELEDGPRGVYCGAIGWIAPGGGMSFNVAIRTLTCFSDNSLVYNVGSGIVADSIAESEYEECLLKSRLLEMTPAISG